MSNDDWVIVMVRDIGARLQQEGYRLKYVELPAPAFNSVARSVGAAGLEVRLFLDGSEVDVVLSPTLGLKFNASPL